MSLLTCRLTVNVFAYASAYGLCWSFEKFRPSSSVDGIYGFLSPSFLEEMCSSECFSARKNELTISNVITRYPYHMSG